MDILATIESKLPRLSKGQKRIAQYILDEFEKAAFMTAAVLGKTVQVSESTVVRFASELGCSGYPQLQKILQEAVLHRLSHVQRIDTEHLRLQEENVLSMTLSADAERLHKTMETIDNTAFLGAVDAIANARRVYVLAAGSSAALAGFFAYYLRCIFEDVRLITSASTGVVMQELVRMTPRDVLVSISFPRYCRSVLKAQEFAHLLGADTVALTDTENAPLAKHTRYLLTAKSDIVSFVESLTAPMSVINALIAALAGKRHDQLRVMMDKLEDVWDTYDIYEKFDE